MANDLESILHLYEIKMNSINREIDEMSRLKLEPEDEELIKSLNLKVEIYREFINQIQKISKLN